MSIHDLNAFPTTNRDLDALHGAEDLIAQVVSADANWSEVAHDLADRAMVDTLAIGIAGSQSRQANIAAATVLPGMPGPVPRAPLWSDSRLHHVGDAAYVAGTAAHSLDWDDYMHPMHGHCSSVLLGTIFPLGEALDSDGPTLVEAYLTGYQVNWLASLALSHSHYRQGWHATSTVGVLGAAAAAGRLLGLTEAQARHALGAAASLASGVRANFGTTTKASHAGNAARGGVQAALLAQAGGTSSPRWLTGPAGMIEAFGAEFDAEGAVREIEAGATRGAHGLETPWGLVQKPYACCGSIHGAVDALLDLLGDEGVATAEIESVVAHVDPLVTSIMRHEQPADEQQARYSPSWVVAAATVDREAGPAQFEARAVERADIGAFRAKVRIEPDLVAGDDDRFGARVEVHTAGRTYVRSVTEPRGHPRRPFTDDELSNKARRALALVCDAEAVADLLPVIQSIGVRDTRTIGNAIRDQTTGTTMRASGI